jgi:pimeloyl-ACP methyl ester carboxylesterase
MLKPLAGIQSRKVQTSRLLTHFLHSGNENGIPLVFIHGNFSSSTYFEELMLKIPDTYRCIAVDLRGYGFSEDLPTDATGGVKDWSEDLKSLFETIDISQAHLIGWSAGAAAVMQFTIDYTNAVKSLTLIAPVSPFGFGGSKDLEGTPCFDDYAGSGGGMIDPEFIERIRTNDRTSAHLQSPRNVMSHSLATPSFHFSREEDFLTASLLQKVGEKHYPGDYIVSPNWPYTSPGRWGPINALSAKYLDLSEIVNVDNKPPILWVRGDIDTIISDRSMADPAVLGEMQLLPDWPGIEIYPTQPMVSQMRSVLERYRANSGRYSEIVAKGVGHSPFLEKPNDFFDTLSEFITRK